MSKKVSLNIESDLYQRLENRFKGDEQGLKQFIIEAIRKQLPDLPADSLPKEKDNLEDYLKNSTSGSRTYGIKGQGW
jgi:hypothetical protein